MEARGADTPPDDRRRQLARIEEKVGDLPALPHIAMRALKLAEREDWNITDSRFPDRYRRVIDLVETSETETFRDAEQEVFGFAHTDVGFLVATGWHLPPVIAEVMLFHHEPALVSSQRNLCATVSLANSACAKHGVSVESQPELDLGSLASTQILGLDESQLEESMRILFTDTTRPSTGAG